MKCPNCDNQFDLKDEHDESIELGCLSCKTKYEIFYATETEGQFNVVYHDYYE